MPKVRTYYSQVQSNALTRGAQATDIRALTDDGKQALYGAAADLGNFGMQLGLKEMAFNDSISQAKAVQIMRNAELDYQTKIEKDPDTNNWPKYHKEVIQNAQAEIKKLKFGTNKGQKQNDIEVSTWNGIFTKSAQVKMIKQKSRDALAVAEAVYEAESEYDDGTPDSAVKINAARNAYQEALKNSYSPEVAKVILAKTDAKINAQKAYNIAYGNALGLAQRGGWDAALQQINDPKWQAQSGLSPDDIEKLTNQIENQQTASERAIEITQQQQEDDFNKRKRAGESPDYEAIDKSPLSPEKKEAIKTAWTDFYRGKSITDDNVLVDTLKQEATKVYLGEVNRDEYTRKVRDAFFKDRKISDSTYDELLAKMDNPLTPEQAKIVSSNVYETRQQILAEVTGGITLDLGGGQSIPLGSRQGEKEKELQDRLKWVNLYESQLTKWVIENKGNVGREFNQESARLRAIFTNASFAEIQEKVFNAENPITDSKIYNVKTRLPIDGEPTISTKEEFDKLPAGSFYINQKTGLRAKKVE